MEIDGGVGRECGVIETNLNHHVVRTVPLERGGKGMGVPTGYRSVRWIAVHRGKCRVGQELRGHSRNRRPSHFDGKVRQGLGCRNGHFKRHGIDVACTCAQCGQFRCQDEVLHPAVVVERLVRSNIGRGRNRRTLTHLDVVQRGLKAHPVGGLAGSGHGVGGALRNRSTSRCSRKPTVIGTAIRHRRQGNLSHRRTQIDGVLHHNRLYGVEVAVQFNHRVVVGTTVVGQTGVRLEVLNTAEVGVERTNGNGLDPKGSNGAGEVYRYRCLHPVVVFHDHRYRHGGNGIKTHVLYHHLGSGC